MSAYTERNERVASEAKKSVWTSMPWMLVWAMLTFICGTLFSAGMGWGRSSVSLDNLRDSVSRLEGAVNTLTKNFVDADKVNSTSTQKMEDHLEYNDQRLDHLEAQVNALLGSGHLKP